METKHGDYMMVKWQKGFAVYRCGLEIKGILVSEKVKGIKLCEDKTEKV